MSVAGLIRGLRLTTGLVLTFFVVGHLSNLALGLLSIDRMAAATPYLLAPWLTPTGTYLLLVCGVVHALLGLQAIAARRSFTLSATDSVQIILAVAILPLLMPHLLLGGIAYKLTEDFHPDYTVYLAIYWRFAPLHALRQLLAVMVVWTHAGIGIYSWLVLTRAWNRIGSLILLVLFGVPVLALLGFVKAGTEILNGMAQDPDFGQDMEAEWHSVVAISPQLEHIEMLVLSASAALALTAIAILVMRALVNRRRRVEVVYDGDVVAEGRLGLTLLELSRLNGVPHAHVCSGRGRCGTCQVEIEHGAEHLSRMRGVERGTLAAVRAAPHVRLACQARVLGPGVRATRLLPPFVDAAVARDPDSWRPEPEILAETGS